MTTSISDFPVGRRMAWGDLIPPLLLTVCVRALSPFIFVERLSTLPWTGILAFIILLYVWLGSREPGGFRAFSDSAPKAVFLLLVLSASAVVLDPAGRIPPRWTPGGPSDLPGVLGVFLFLAGLSIWSVRRLVGLRQVEDAENPSGESPGREARFFLPVPMYFLAATVEGAFRGRPVPLIVVLGSAVLYWGTAHVLWPRLPGSWKKTAGRIRLRASAWFWDDRAFAVLIALFAFSLRAWFAYTLNRSVLDPRFLGGPDSGTYDMTAWALASGAKHILDPSLALYGFNPGPSLIYALIYKVIGHRPDAIRYLQAVLAAINVVLLFRLARDGFGAVPARIAAFLIAGRGYLIAYGTYLGSETLALFFLTLLVLLLQKVKQLAQAQAWGWARIGAGAAGLTLGILALNRPEYQFFLLFGLAWLALSVSSRRTGILAAWTCGVLLILGAMMLRNLLAHGEFALNARTALLTQWGFKSLNPYVPPPDTVLDGRFFQELLIFAVHHPLQAIQIIGGHLIQNFYDFWNWKQYVFNPAFVFLIRNERLIMWIGAFLTSAFVIGVIAARTRASILSLLYLIVGYKALFHLFTFNNEWWRFSIEPFINLFQAFGLYLLAICLAERGTLGKGAVGRTSIPEPSLE